LFIIVVLFALFALLYLVPQLAEERQIRNRYRMVTLGSSRADIEAILQLTAGSLAMASDPEMVEDEILAQDRWRGELSAEAYLGKNYAIEVYYDHMNRVIGKTLVALAQNGRLEQMGRACGKGCGFLLKKQPAADSQEEWRWKRSLRTISW
jgi:hypothetical protein